MSRLHTMLKKIFLTILGLLGIIAVLGGVYAMMIKQLIAAGESFQEPPKSVSTVEVQEDEWEVLLSTVGTVSAVQGITVSAEADGVIREIAFTPGAKVEAGDVLVRLDTEIEESQLRAARAAAELARSNARRARELFESRTISRAEIDAAEAALQQAEAQIASIEAQIAKKTVRAPFAGRLGIRQVSLGQYLNRGDPVVSLQAFDPVFIEFSLPQQHLARLEEGLEVRVATDAFPGETFRGKITALNPQVDPRTRNLRIQATVRNADGRLRPGLFAEVDVVLPGKEKVLIVPVTAVLDSTSGDSVYVVKPAEGEGAAPGQLIVEQRLVRTGPTRGDFVVVTAGLEAGEKVVRAGAFKLRSGSTVVESDVGVPPAQLNPDPKDA